MNFSPALFKERLIAALECPPPDAPGARTLHWTAERVSEYLRARLDAEQPAESGPD